jgi:hypothetical protein
LVLALARQILRTRMEGRTDASSEGADLASDGYAAGAANITCAD